MKKFLVLATAVLIAGCSPTKEIVEVYQGPPGTPGRDGVSCSVTQVENGAVLSCSDETVVTILNGTNGSNGQDGSNGEDGQDAQSCSVEQLENGAEITCPNGSATVLNGADGQDGEDGEDGSDGDDGMTVTIADYTSSSCTRITGTSTYIKIGNSNAGLYTSSFCHSSTKFAEISQGESYWPSSSTLAIWYDDGVRVLTFN